MGQHAGIVQIQLHVSGWVNITGMVGQHETEWWVSMVRNLHIDKYVDHLPLYRQEQRFNLVGITLAPSTLCNWKSGVCNLLMPLLCC